jgi:hypothetical protein
VWDGHGLEANLEAELTKFTGNVFSGRMSLW